MTTIIYIIGYIVAYLFMKWGRNKMEFPTNWGIIFITAVISLFSWMAVIALIVVTLIIYLSTTKLPKPPKWL